jgi:ubiquinone/menaquinone biosynthesis C-methylase UbiE
MRQKEVFLASEGDEYHRRNASRVAELDSRQDADRVLRAIKSLQIRPTSVLEIGCGRGSRLERFRLAYGARCVGVEPSRVAIADGAATFPDVSFKQGTADRLEFADRRFDLVIFGFCLYLCDREYLFSIAAEADRVLDDCGHIAIEDFYPPFPYRKPYRHDRRITTYKMDYARLFSWNPAYTLLFQATYDHDGRPDISDVDARVSVSILTKDTRGAYPWDPFSAA